MRALEAMGVTVHVASVDVSDEIQLRAYLDRYAGEAWPAIRGVVHGAGSFANELAARMDRRTFDAVVRPKLLGAQLLDRLLPDLDLFVMFSSTGAFLAQPGQANYAAANAGLDAVAQDRRARGLPAMSIAWGIWANTGLVKDEAGVRNVAEMARQGIGSFTPERGAAMFAWLCGQSQPTTVVLPMDWAAFRRARGGRDFPIFREVMAGAAADAPGAGDLVASLGSANAAERRQILDGVVRDTVSRVLKIAASRLDPRKTLGSMGLNSLMAMELRNRLEATLGRPLSATLAWNYPTVEALVAHLAGADPAAPAAAPAATAPRTDNSASLPTDMLDGLDQLSALSDEDAALMAKQVRQQAEHVLRADPVAIVGMACRVPGGGDSPELFWQLLRDGTDAIREVPADRWDADAWYDSDPSAIGKTVTKWAGFLEHIDGFDAEYFGILPREAQHMDPQQRLFLEVAIEALDDAGLTREQLRGSRAGVFIASYHNDYAQLQYSDVDAIDLRTLTGTLHSVLANRLSYFLDLRGPSISIDTACSSSLVATHLACQSLRHGESDIAIAGGVSVIIAPELLVSMSKVGFMAPDGRCKTFDASADGFGRGEGCGIVVLKRLSDAIADGDRVLAVVRGSAVNQDGHSTLLAAPSGPAQQALIEEALAGAQLDAGRIGLMETHGTGTALGDPIEVEAIAATIGRPAAGAGPCLLGSAKANVGHLEAAAGVTGLIKSVLALRHEAVPPQVHFHRLSPHISLQGTRLAVPTSLVPWPKGEVPRCAAISSFGVGGTNAHVIVEEAPSLPGENAEASRDQLRVLSLSAHSDAALRELAAAWSGFLERTPESAADLCYTATQRRTHHDYRLALVGRSKSDLAARIADYLRDDVATGFAAGRRPAISGPRVAFVFSGQGPQWHAMGRELMASEPVFRDAIEACDRVLRPWSGWSLLEALAATEADTRVDQTEALFAVQVALAALWKSWGIEPDAVVGHSVGEIAALHVAGVLTLEQAIRVVWHRGRIMQQATGFGRMASVGLTAGQAAELVRPYGERLSVAAINAPRSVVLSGETEALTAVLAELTARGVEHRLLPVQYAFHSAQMAPFQQRLADELADLHSATAMIPVYSTVMGGLAADVNFDAGYFGRNVREPVRIADAIRAMADDGHTAFLEIGPHPVLGSTIAECFAAHEEAHVAVLASLRRGKPERETMLLACAGLYAAGCVPAWHAFQEDFGNVVSLPPTAWQRKRYWLRRRPAAQLPAGG
ncbi:MAG: acyltransferase domain-containing protein, partial [Rhodocyclales bacterium]|nr:acyltransferase domain-containing protein [Rhodocyclales bacterium]